MASDIVAAVISHWKTPYGYKKIIPSDTTAIFGINKKDEAHYLCVIINSKTIRTYIKSYSSAGRGFGTPSVMNHIAIPKFDSKNSLHLQLANLSMNLHKLAIKAKCKEIIQLEDEVNDLVNKMFGIK